MPFARFVDGVRKDLEHGVLAAVQSVRAEDDARALAHAVRSLERRDALIAVIRFFCFCHWGFSISPKFTILIFKHKTWYIIRFFDHNSKWPRQIFAFGGKMQKFAGISAPIMPKDVEHNKALTGGNALEQQSYSQFPQSFPHRYVNRITADKP